MVYIYKIPNCGETSLRRQCSECFLKTVAEEFFGTKDPEVSRLPSGKPVVNCGYVSVSHSDGFIAIAADSVPVGVDLQVCANVHMDKISVGFFTERELRNFAEKHNKDEFFFTWCKKEALWKSLDVQPPTIGPVDTVNGEFTLSELNLNGKVFYLAVTGKHEIQNRTAAM